MARRSGAKWAVITVILVTLLILYHSSPAGTADEDVHLPATPPPPPPAALPLRDPPPPPPPARKEKAYGRGDQYPPAQAQAQQGGGAARARELDAKNAPPGAGRGGGGADRQQWVPEPGRVAGPPSPPDSSHNKDGSSSSTDEDEDDDQVAPPPRAPTKPKQLDRGAKDQRLREGTGAANAAAAAADLDDSAFPGEDDDEPATNKASVDDDDDLDVAPRIRKVPKGSVNKLNKPYVKGAAKPAARKKPNLQAGEDVEKLKWGGGWSERFKQKPDAAAAAAAGAAGEPLAASPGDDSTSPDSSSSSSKTTILSHPLVARFASFRFARPSPPASKTKATKPEDDTFQAHPSSSSSPPQSYNLTLCALVPSEARFLPEWLLYHSLLGVERFALYDTSAAGAVGAEEIDALADEIEESGKGEAAPKAAEIKAGIGRTASGLDLSGKIWPDRIAGLERWIEQGVVTFHWMKFKDTKKARSFHEEMMNHCSATYSSSTNFLAHLDVDEFIILSDTLYGTNVPYQESPSSTSTTTTTTDTDPPAKTTTDLAWRYPLHDFLDKPNAKEAACIPIPQLRFRNVGVKTLPAGDGVLNIQTRRDVIDSAHRDLPEKTLLHTAFTASFVHFDGPHSCRVDSSTPTPEGLTREIRDSQGEVLQSGGVFKSTRLPTEPLAIAHFFQRDLTDCRQKMAVVQDPNSLHTKGRGTVECEEQYLPSQAELKSPSFVADAQNRFLLRLPQEGSVIEDLRARDSWAAKAAGAVLKSWRTRAPPTAREIEQAREKVIMLSF
ncbi:hypothetical protein RQP46_005747 [Phenoliferia psychrophenolica]